MGILDGLLLNRDNRAKYTAFSIVSEANKLERLGYPALAAVIKGTLGVFDEGGEDAIVELFGPLDEPISTALAKYERQFN